jgi:hypothetical protein
MRVDVLSYLTAETNAAERMWKPADPTEPIAGVRVKARESRRRCGDGLGADVACEPRRRRRGFVRGVGSRGAAGLCTGPYVWQRPPASR